MLLILMFFILYLVPVVPTARRVAWKIQNKKSFDYSLPERRVESSSYGYVRTNEMSNTTKELCNNCGGGQSTHPDGIHNALFRASRRGEVGYTIYAACDNFEPWDEKTKEWPASTFYKKVSPQRTIPKALLISLAWPVLAGKAGTKKVYHIIDPDWNSFALPPEAVRNELRLKELEAENDRLERELEIGPYSKEES